MAEPANSRNLVNGELIVLAREYRGKTAAELAEELGVHKSLISKIENSWRPASDELLANLSRVLNLPVSFFTRPERVYPSNLHWRKRVTAGPRYVRAAEAEMNVHRLAIERMLKSVDVHAKPLPAMDVEEHGSPRIVAKTVRQLWNVPRGPINELFALIEKSGIIIVPCDFESGIDGRSMYTKDRLPIIFVDRNSPTDRQRLTVAHELGHLIMHTNFPVSEERDVEKEAMAFASELLMPQDQLRPQLERPIRMDVLADLKRYWRVSMAAILYRAKEEKLITPTNLKRMWMEFSRLGLKKREPLELDPPAESPILIKWLVEAHQQELDMTLEAIAEMCGLGVAELRDKYVEQGKKKHLLYSR